MPHSAFGFASPLPRYAAEYGSTVRPVHPPTRHQPSQEANSGWLISERGARLEWDEPQGCRRVC